MSVTRWSLIMMLLGMFLMRTRLLSAGRSEGFYRRLSLITYPVGFALVYLRTRHLINHEFDLLSFDVDRILHYPERLAISLGHLGLLCLFVKSGILKWLKTSLAAVGRMALTNYFLQSIICSLVFFGYGMGLFGKVDLRDQLWLVGAVWLFQMIASPIWLRYFRFGPLEWGWRSLTYLKRQPLKN